MEILLACIVAVSMVVSVIVYAYLVENKKIDPMPLGRHGGFEVKYTEEHYKKFDKKYKEEEGDTVQGQSDSKKATT